MGFIGKAMKKVTADELKSTQGGGTFVGIDAGDYVAKIIDVQIKEYGPAAKNAGYPYLALEMSLVENWDGDPVPQPAKIRGNVGLFSHWPSSGSLNFTLFQFLKAIEGGWDFEEDGPLIEIEDEQDAQETLLEQLINVRVGYSVSKPSEKYPNANVFPELDRYLLQDADLVPNVKLGDYETYKEKIVAKYSGDNLARVSPARDDARSRDTDTKWSL